MLLPQLILERVSEKPSKKLNLFLGLSTALTGFKSFDLLGTGLAEEYYDYVLKELGQPKFDQILDAFEPSEGSGLPKLLADADLGPPLRNIIKLWYLGQWFDLPGSGRSTPDGSVILSQWYPEGLVWRAIGAHPAGAKQQGFGAWSQPPLPADSE